jgi:hypothetical protein
MVPSVQHLHGEAVALSDQDVVRQPPVSHLMAVSLGWSGWGGLWFDGKGKIPQIIPIVHPGSVM